MKIVVDDKPLPISLPACVRSTNCGYMRLASPVVKNEGVLSFLQKMSHEHQSCREIGILYVDDAVLYLCDLREGLGMNGG